MRMEMLSDNEEKVIDALRLVARSQQDIQRTAAQEDMRNELGRIYEDLAYVAPEELPRVVEEVLPRIYNLLH